MKIGNKIKSLIAENKTEEAIKMLMNNVENQDELLKLVILQSAKLNKLKKEQIQGINSFEENRISKAAIDNNLLDIIDQLPGDIAEKGKNYPFSFKGSESFKLIYLIIGISAMIGIAIYVLSINTDGVEIATIFGKVTEADYKPIKDVKINIDGTRLVSTSRSDGNFYFDVDDYRIGDIITIVTFHESYNDVELDIELKSTNQEIPLILVPLVSKNQ